MKYEWKQTIFTPEELNAGDYIVREHINKLNNPHFVDAGYLSTMMMKIGWGHASGRKEIVSPYYLIDMSDGMIVAGVFSGITKSDNGSMNFDNAVWNPFEAEKGRDAKQKLCDYLNNNPHGETFRRATQEEVVRVILYQKSRCS
jgi:hypothetical protein